MTATTILTEVLTVMVLAATAGTQTGACADRYDIEQFRTQTLANAEQQLTPTRYALFEEAYTVAYGDAYNAPDTCKEVLKAMNVTPADFERQLESAKLGVDIPLE